MSAHRRSRAPPTYDADVTWRWRLNRAGITNVYQYVDETLHFGGGRLLLRGVNGSGKSTAMNMLLPFLLEADTRRIDAAGEQSSVLKSWMLTGRDEQQPVGYLWIEFERGDGNSVEHLVCGCGIKANRSTDRVSTWWFITNRRPGIDLALTDHRTPLGPDALRDELGSHAVFADSARPAYRSAVRAALFGGRDIDQHLRLLHVVRNPRVGDRIDTELTDYLADSLPQLSDDAVDDAAQPLEDLDEHRRNVRDLTRTADTLQALLDVYQSYVAGHLRERAGHLLTLANDATRLRRRSTELRREADRTTREREELRVSLEQLAAEQRRLTNEIAALEAAPAYRDGQELDQLRQLVETLRRTVEAASARVQERVSAVERRSAIARDHSAATIADHARLGTEVSGLGVLSRQCRLVTTAPTLPPVARAAAEAGPGEPGEPSEEPAQPLDEPVLQDLAPAAAFVIQPAIDQLDRIRQEVRRRHGDVTDVRRALDEVDRHLHALVAAERACDSTDAALEAAGQRLTAARAHYAEAVATWRTAANAWAGRLDGLAIESADGTEPSDQPRGPDPSDPSIDVATAHAALLGAADRVVSLHALALADARREHSHAIEEIARLDQALDELAHRTHPEPPAGAWQRSDGRTRLADCIDFADHLGDPERCGLEAALEAAGLLGAELTRDGGLTLATGELVVVAAQPVEASLARLLTVTLPEDCELDHDAVVAVLAGISTDPAADHADQVTAVGADGTFRVGALRGRHHKAVAEHIGVTARRAAIERRRAELAALLRLATGHAAVCQATVDAATERLRRTETVRGELPSPVPVARADQSVQAAADERDRLDADHQRAVRALAAAEAACAEATDAAERLAFSHQLPADRSGLDEVAAQLTEVTATADRVATGIAALVGAHRSWVLAVDDLDEAVGAHRRAVDELTAAADEHEPQAMRLATLEDAIGTEYAEVLAALDLSRADVVTTAKRQRETQGAADLAIAAAATAAALAEAAEAELGEAERRCVAALGPFRAALEVPGVLDAVSELAEVPNLEPLTIAESVDGVRGLAESLLRHVAAPARDVTADGLRQSIRQRRDQLGAGWDAEDHQPDPSLPITVEVNGPSGRTALPAASRQVAAQLTQRAGLLTAQQDQALRNLLQGRVAGEVAEKMHAAGELVGLMNRRLEQIATAHGIGVRLSWKRAAELPGDVAEMVDLLARTPDLRTADHDARLAELLATHIDAARSADPERRYRDLIADLFDYRRWHEMTVLIVRPGRSNERLSRRTQLSEGEKKIVTYLPLFAAVAASYDALAEGDRAVPRFLLLDDAFAKVSEDNHGKLFGLLVELDLDFIATSERLWGTHATVPELAITEVLRDADLGVIVLEHSRWNGRTRSEVA